MKNKTQNMYGYVYMTTNLITNKIYIGQKKSDKFIENYYGSGIYIKRSLKKYGKENFRIELITWCETKTEINEYEKFYIKISRCQDIKYGYNISKGGEGEGRKHSEETKLKIKNTLIDKKYTYTSPRKGIKMTDEQKNKISESQKLRYKNKDSDFYNNWKNKLSESSKLIYKKIL